MDTERLNPSSRDLQPVEIRFQSGELAVRAALADLITALEPMGLDADETGTVQIVVAEVLNNVVEHAFAPPEPEGTIRLNCACMKDGLHLHIIDAGLPMPDGNLPLGNLPDMGSEVDDLPEGGFGWFMIQTLAKDVEYRREGEENHLRFRIAVAVDLLN